MARDGSMGREKLSDKTKCFVHKFEHKKYATWSHDQITRALYYTGLDNDWVCNPFTM